MDDLGMVHHVENILGYPVTSGDVDTCARTILSWIVSGDTKKYLACINPHSVAAAESDNAFKEALRNSDLLIPDGIGIVLVSKIFRGSIRNRITGSDIFLKVNSVCNEGGHHTAFFLGSTPETLTRIKDRMKREFPNVKVVGTYSPPFKLEFSDADNRSIIEVVNQVQPDILWVGMTAPKQEKWIYANRHRLQVPFIGAIGAVFDFYAGNKKRPGPFLQKIGLEWMGRFLTEPRRLWKRYFVSLPIFFLCVLREKFIVSLRNRRGGRNI